MTDSFVMGGSFFLEKEAVVFVFGYVALDKRGEVDNELFDLVAGKSLSKNIGKLFIADQLQEKGKGALIEFTIETETDMVGIKTQ